MGFQIYLVLCVSMIIFCLSAQGYVQPSHKHYENATVLKHENSSVWEWKWDHYCYLQARQGSCQQALTRFYYDIRNDACKSFVYSGCDGNRNNFVTSAECEKNCKGVNGKEVQGLKQPAFCFLQPDKGLCLALFTKFYYDINDKTCKEFNYGGCDGNQNNFKTKSSCMETCSDLV